MKGVRGERLAGEFQKEIYNIITNKLRAKEPSLSVVIKSAAESVAVGTCMTENRQFRRFIELFNNFFNLYVHLYLRNWRFSVMHVPTATLSAADLL